MLRSGAGHKKIFMRDQSSSNPIAELITSRRTIYEFRNEPVPPPEIIKRAIDISRWAPNHHLTEPWHFYLPGKETITGIIELNTELVREKSGAEAARKKQARWSGIPGWLVLSCDVSDDPVLAQENYAACSCVAQNLMLYLWSENIGTKWSTGSVVRDRRFYDLLWIDPSAETVTGLFWYGYAREIPVTTRKSLQQILVELP